MEKPIFGSVRVCNGLYCLSNAETWERPDGNWGKYPSEFLEYPEWAGDLPYVRGMAYVGDVGLLCNFPYLPYDIKPILIKNIRSCESQDLIAILNDVQASFSEDLLLELGFSVFNRTINPRHSSKLVLYHRSPKELELEA